MSGLTPAIQIGGSASAENNPSALSIGSIADDYAQLIALGSDTFQGSGSTIFHMDAGAMSLASPAQIGRVIQGQTVTASMVASNQALLDAIGVYCRAHGITITVEAQLDNSQQADWTYQWLSPAVQANLPITAVENDSEVAASDPASAFATDAKNEVAIVKQIVKYYPSVKIGQWEGGNGIAASQSWWTTYDAAAKQAGLPGISYVVADTSWNAPWQTSQAAWVQWLTTLSTTTHSDGMQLDVLLDGVDTDLSDQQWVAQSEQHAAMLASLSGVQVNQLLVRPWTPAYPTSVSPNNDPTTIGNDALEIASTYALYQSGLISATGQVGISAPAQLVLSVAVATSLSSISLSWDQSDVSGNTELAVVITDSTGILTGAASGGGLLQGSGTQTLVLEGTAQQLVGELASVKILEPVAGPDTLDIEDFGVNGRLADAQVQVLSVSGGPQPGSGTLEFEPAAAAQQWTSASAVLTSIGKISSETTYWNSSENTIGGSYQSVDADAIYEPLATSTLVDLNGGLVNSAANPTIGGALALPLGTTSYIDGAYNPTASLVSLIVLNTVESFSPASGNLETRTDDLADVPTPPSLAHVPLTNYLATGGQQITQYNTGDNPDWSSGWSQYLASVTTTYDDSGAVIEQEFTGGSTEPYFTLINVYDPYNGNLWEQFETNAPGAPYAGFVSGLTYVTQFNTGDNPNWDWKDWGTAAQVTVTWQDYYATKVSTLAPVRTGPFATDAYGLNGITSSNSGETIIQAANGTTSIVGAGKNIIYAGTGSDTINTGGGGSQIYLSSTAGSIADIKSGGNDTIWAGLTDLSLSDLTSHQDLIYANGLDIKFIGGSDAQVSGVDNTVSATGFGGTVTLNGSGNSAETGDGSTITIYGSASSATSGNGTVGWVWGTGDILNVGNNAQVWTPGTAVTLMAGSYATVDLAGTGDIATLGSYSVLWMYGSNQSATLLDHANINIFVPDSIATGGVDSKAWLAGSADQVTLGADSAVTDVGTSDVIISVGVGETVTLDGTKGTAEVGNGGTITLLGQLNTATTGTDAIGWVWGTGDILTVGDGSQVWVPGTYSRVTSTGAATVDLVGIGDTATLASGSVMWMYGAGQVVTVGDHTITDMYASDQTATAGAYADMWVAGQSDKVVAGADAMINLVGSAEAASCSNSSTIVITGSGDSITAATGSTIGLYGVNETVIFPQAGGSLTITGLSLTKGDLIDIAPLLSTAQITGGVSAISQYTNLTSSGPNEVLTVNGSMGTERVTLSGVTNITLSNLTQHGVLTLFPT